MMLRMTGLMRRVQALSRLSEQSAMQAPTPPQLRQYQMLQRLDEELEMIVWQLKKAVEQCGRLLEEQIPLDDFDTERDLGHLRERMEATTLQMEDTLATLERLSRRLRSRTPATSDEPRVALAS